VHIIVHKLHTVHSDVARQNPVQFIRQLLKVNGLTEIKVRHHLSRMHACVSPASTRHADLLAQQGRESPLQFCLH
jgi:hypothetical protein